MNVCAKVLIISCVFGLSPTVRHHFKSLETGRAVQMIEDGLSQRRVVRYLGVSPSVINRLWALETGNYNRRPGQGKPRATTDNQDRYLRISALRNRQSTARGLRYDLQLSTLVRVSRRPATGPILTIAHRANRRNFAQDHIGW